MRFGGVLVVGLAACNGGGDNFGYDGYPMEDFFPFDGQRSWTFTNTDEAIDYRVVSTLNTEPEAINDNVTRVFDVDYATECLPEATDCTPGVFRIAKLRMSADGTYGVLIHGMDDGSGLVAFDPPVELAATEGKLDDQWQTETGGETFISRFMGLEDCPVAMAVEGWDECVHLHLDDDGDESTAGSHPLHGDWWAVAGYNVIAFQLTDDDGQWQLSDTTYTPLD